MKKFTYSVSMLGFMPVQGKMGAENKKDAEVAAINIFSDHNDLKHEEQETVEELINFYGPVVKQIK
jgi:hypothetical protein